MMANTLKYSIVLFLKEENVVDLIPSSWITSKKGKLKCFYPPQKDFNMITEWLCSLAEPQDSWKCHSVEVLAHAKSVKQGEKKLRQIMQSPDNLDGDANTAAAFQRRSSTFQLEAILNSIGPISPEPSETHQETRTTDQRQRNGSQISLSIETDDKLRQYIDNKFEALLKSVKKEINVAKNSILYDMETKFRQLEASLSIKIAAREEEIDVNKLQYDFNLPFKTQQDFLDFEEKIRNETETKQALMTLIRAKIVGEQTVQGCIKAIFPVILSKDVQLQYSGTGKVIRNVSKLNFSATHLYSCFESVLKNKFSDNTDLKGLVAKVGQWLSGARDREGGRKERMP